MKLLIFEYLIIFIHGSVSSAAAMGLEFVFSELYRGFDKLRCPFYENCSPNCDWIQPNIKALELSLSEHLHGQHLAAKVVTRALKSHLTNEQPSKALVMSFHGLVGVGKTYVARLIIDSIYKLGHKSQYVHKFMGPLHFPHKDLSDEYKSNLQSWIQGNVSMCERSLFIFEEIDKMPIGVIDGIKPFIDYYESINGVDARKSIFIFMSNTGGSEIVRTTLEHWTKGKTREKITLEDMETTVKHRAFNEKGGLHESDLILHSLVDFYVPFLPLEHRHVELCAKDEVRRRGHKVDKEIVKRVADNMKYFPPGNKLFSITGCRGVAQKVAYHHAMDMNDELFD